MLRLDQIPAAVPQARTVIDSSVSLNSGRNRKLWRTMAEQISEALIKVLCQNIYMLVQTIYQLNIAAIFGGKAVVAATGL